MSPRPRGVVFRVCACILGLCFLQLHFYGHVTQRSLFKYKLPTMDPLRQQQQRIHADLMRQGSKLVLSSSEIDLTFKYWEMVSWITNLTTNANVNEQESLPVPYDFSNQSLWGFPGEEEKVLAQLTWRLQLIIGNFIRTRTFPSGTTGPTWQYGRYATLGLPHKRIFIGNINNWPDWALMPHWIESGRISGCSIIPDVNLPNQFAELEPQCSLVRTKPDNWDDIDLVVSYIDRNPLPLTRVSPDSEEEAPVPVLQQIPWFKYVLESPHTYPLHVTSASQFVNSYWSGSPVQDKYAKWVYFDPYVRAKPQLTDYSVGKSKMVAMLVSNCNAYNGRMKYARELSTLIDVDVYGQCGELSCGSPQNREECSHILRQYKFYLAFENSNCQDYVTEKLHRNCFENNVIPIVMGAPPAFYRHHAPQNSYIHVQDFQSPQALAAYLHVVASIPTIYNEFFQWRGTGEFVLGYGSRWFCSVCAMLYFDEGTPPPPPAKRPVQWLPKFKVQAQSKKPLCLPKDHWYW